MGLWMMMAFLLIRLGVHHSFHGDMNCVLIRELCSSQLQGIYNVFVLSTKVEQNLLV